MPKKKAKKLSKNTVATQAPSSVPALHQVEPPVTFHGLRALIKQGNYEKFLEDWRRSDVGALFDQKSSLGQETLLLFACRQWVECKSQDIDNWGARYNIIVFLLKQNANTFATNLNDQTPLMVLATINGEIPSAARNQKHNSLITLCSTTMKDQWIATHPKREDQSYLMTIDPDGRHHFKIEDQVKMGKSVEQVVVNLSAKGNGTKFDGIFQYEDKEIEGDQSLPDTLHAFQDIISSCKVLNGFMVRGSFHSYKMISITFNVCNAELLKALSNNFINYSINTDKQIVATIRFDNVVNLVKALTTFKPLQQNHVRQEL